MIQMHTPFEPRNSFNSYQPIADRTAVPGQQISGSEQVLAARRPGSAARAIDLGAPDSGEAVTVSAATADVIVFRFSADDAKIIGRDDSLVV